MPEIQEVFRMATQKVRPDPGALDRQYGRRRRRMIRQKVAVFGLVAAVVVAAAIAVAIVPHRTGKKTPNSTPSTGVKPAAAEQAVIVGLDGSLVGTVGMPSSAFALSLSPDGSTVAFADADGRLATIGIDGSGLRELTGPMAVQGPAWSPDGSLIAFQGLRHSNRDIFVITANGSGLRRLTTSPHDDEWPAWSPDGSTIVYDNAGNLPLDGPGFSPTQEIYTVPVLGGKPTRLTVNHVDDSQPSFSPDGSQIVYHSDQGIWLINADGSDPHAVDIPRYCCTGFTPRFSPDGSKIAFTRYDPTWQYRGLAVVRLYILDLSTGTVSAVGRNEMSTDMNPPQWIRSGNAFFLYRVAHP
jgi:Tol biopolymer transport system component